MKYTIFSLTFLLMIPSYGQPYVEGGHTRHRFAQLNLGVEMLGDPFSSSTFLQPRLIIGGIHFWGHADLYLSIPLFQPQKPIVLPEIETGARIYPWAIQNGKARPFFGASFFPRTIKMDNGPSMHTLDLSLHMGVGYLMGDHLLSATLQFFPQDHRLYPTIEGVRESMALPKFYAGLRYTFLLDGTLSAEKDWQSGRTAFLEDTLSKLGRLDGWTFGIGVSSAFFMQTFEQEYLQSPLLDRHRISSVFPEFSLGYYFDRPDLQLEMIYRGVKSKQEGYDSRHEMKRQSLGWVAYHFFADYHGFAPFGGGGLSHEWVNIEEWRNDDRIDQGSISAIRPVLVAGWDIRPNRLQGFYLRTSIRWTPNSVGMESGAKFRLDQLEVNFIQLVIHPKRW